MLIYEVKELKKNKKHHSKQQLTAITKIMLTYVIKAGWKQD